MRMRMRSDLGVKGITNSVEDVIVARDILLAKETGVRCICATALQRTV